MKEWILSSGLGRIIVIIVLIVYGTTSNLYAQVAIKGKVIDLSNLEPISNVLITVKKDSKIQFFSDEKGFFKFQIPQIHAKDSLVFLSIGYEETVYPISDFVKKDTGIAYLSSSVGKMQEIEIEAALNADQILQRAFNKIATTYINFPYTQHAFYRETQMVDDKYVSLLEADVRIYDKGYTSPALEKIHILEGRKTKPYDSEYLNSSFRNTNWLDAILDQNIVRWPKPWKIMGKGRRTLNFQIEGKGIFNEREVYVIKEVDRYSLTFYIDVETYYIHKFEMEWQAESLTDHMFEEKMATMTRSCYHYKKYYEFKEENGTMYPFYFYSFYKERFYDKHELNTIATNEAYFELYVDSVVTKNVKPYTFNLNRKAIMETQIGRYNSDFWKKYEIKKPIENEEKLLKDLQIQVNVDEHFK